MDHSERDSESGRIRILSPELADQIAAGEVVERPASVVKELVENAIDAGASRVEVELHAAGLERIVVVDDGRGMHAEDLPLAITRHATSKVRRPADLVEVATLGFRGEALASLAAVSDLTIESRRAGDPMGTRLRARPGLQPELEPCGMRAGTRIEVVRLFGNVPARRKFMRTEATEVGHCSEAMLRLGIAHPSVHLRLSHGSRQLVDLPGANLPERIAAVLERRVRSSLAHVRGEHDGIEVEAWMGPPDAALRSKNGLFIVVRRRVVSERSLSRIVTGAYGDLLDSGRHPVACLRVEPPSGEVDVNVHPQKSEVRFQDAQRVYSAARRVLEDLRARFEKTTSPDAMTEASAGASESVRVMTAGARAALDRWGARAEPVADTARERGTGSGGGGPQYSLRTRATAGDYAQSRRSLRAEAEQLRGQLDDVRAQRASVPSAPERSPWSPSGGRGDAPDGQLGPRLELLTSLPGPVVLLRHEDDVLAVDLLALRSHLVHRRLIEDLGGSGKVAAQGLLQPAVVKCDRADVELCLRSAEALETVGVVLEAFGDDALLVRAVPAGLRSCVDDFDAQDLVGRILPWLRMREHKSQGTEAALVAIASARGPAPAPRLARRWVRELIDAGADLGRTPGIVRHDARSLMDGTR